MPELLLELLSEEIPARMQKQAATDLARLLTTALAPLTPTDCETFHTPRRIAAILQLQPASPDTEQVERGPRLAAPEAAIAGFLRKHNATQSDLMEEGDYRVLRRPIPGRPAATLIAEALPTLIRRFPWPKSMRWGEGSALTWVRPLRRILCLLEGAVVPFDLREANDDGHTLASANLTEGHRFMAPGAVAVTSATHWKSELAARKVMLSAEDRINAISSITLPPECAIVPDSDLAAEVAGLVEWPVPLLGRIDDAYMDLPPEVMQVSMRVNQRYFALRYTDGLPAPWFAFAANIEAPDNGDAIIAGNERVLRARFADARHFWDLDRRTPLAKLVPALDAVTFHSRLGSQGERVRRLKALAYFIAPMVGADPDQAALAASLCKADLLTGMVSEFPELQGIMGGYYAVDEKAEVAKAIREQYMPKGATESPPTESLSVALGLADRLDLLAGFFSIGERPTGSGDPYGLRRAALGILNFTWWNKDFRLPMRKLIAEAGKSFSASLDVEEVLGFIIERLHAMLRRANARHDVVTAVFQSSSQDDLGLLNEQVTAVEGFLTVEHGINLLAGYRRAANILRIEQKKDNLSYTTSFAPALLFHPAEQALASALEWTRPQVAQSIALGNYWNAMVSMSKLRAPVDTFFEQVTVNDPNPALRANRLRLLASLRDTLHLAADFSKIEG